MSEQRYFFIHIQKTAGSSVRKHLHELFDWQSIYPPKDLDGGMPAFLTAYVDGQALLDLSTDTLEKYALFTGHLPFSTSQILKLDKPPETFTVLRDPVSRTISVLKQKKRKNPKFSTWSLERIYEDPDTFRGQILDHQTKVFAIPPELHYQSAFVHYPVDYKTLKVAKRNLRRVSVVGL